MCTVGLMMVITMMVLLCDSEGSGDGVHGSDVGSSDVDDDDGDCSEDACS